jgi:Domain of Unknown Function (DUF1206)
VCRIPGNRRRRGSRRAGGVVVTAGSAGQTARAAAREAASSRLLQWLARGGLAARGVNYLLVGSLAVLVAFGASNSQADTTGALHAVARHPGGIAVLWLLAGGFAGLALWRLAEAAYGQAGPGGRQAAKRLASFALAVFYGILVAVITGIIAGTSGQSSDNAQSKDATARLMSYPGGQPLVAIIGVALAAAAVGVAVYGWRRKFLNDLRTGQMSARARNLAETLGVVGYTARGVVFAVAGAFLVDAAVTFDPQKAQGIDGSLRTLAMTPLGPWLLAAVALGLVIFGGYSCCEARWRDVQPGQNPVPSAQPAPPANKAR